MLASVTLAQTAEYLSQEGARRDTSTGLASRLTVAATQVIEANLSQFEKSGLCAGKISSEVIITHNLERFSVRRIHPQVVAMPACS